MKTMPIRAYLEDLERIEAQRRKISVMRGGKRVTIAETIRWLLELAEQSEKQED